MENVSLWYLSVENLSTGLGPTLTVVLLVMWASGRPPLIKANPCDSALGQGLYTLSPPPQQQHRWGMYT